jgi:LmbE family N-acetylglucosaminyl deacetylase
MSIGEAPATTPQDKRILLATAHPDDADIMAGGTVARWVDEGHEVNAVIFTRGDKGHDDPTMTSEAVAELREAEQRAAATILGISRLTFLDFADGELAWAGPDQAARSLAPAKAGRSRRRGLGRFRQISRVVQPPA